MKINLSKLMHKAWAIFRKASKAAITFSEALRKAWAWAKVQASNMVKVEAAATAAGVVEEFKSWAGWQAAGRMVIHGEEAVFKIEVDDPTTKSGKRVQSFFTYTQTQTAPAA